MLETRFPPMTLLVVLLFLPLVSVTLGCAALGGKPSTSAPSGSDPNDIWQACYDREDKIYEWEESRKEKVAHDFADGKLNFLQSAIKYEDIEEEARDLRQELTDNCQKKVRNLLPPLPEETEGIPFPTVTPLR